MLFTRQLKANFWATFQSWVLLITFGGRRHFDLGPWMNNMWPLDPSKNYTLIRGYLKLAFSHLHIISSTKGPGSIFSFSLSFIDPFLVFPITVEDASVSSPNVPIANDLTARLGSPLDSAFFTKQGARRWDSCISMYKKWSMSNTISKVSTHTSVDCMH